jgi:formate hydrogenlyase subunit 3/multisubunit Na+/H+ antiporter MnhD subunit
MFGIMVTERAAETGSISEFAKLSLHGEGTIGFFCMTLGAAGLIGCMPFHSWIPDAAKNAPTVFMAAFPGFFLKIFGGMFLIRIFLYLYDIVPFGTVSIILMILGALTAVSASVMAMIQHDLKRLISYIAISQIGFSVMGFGSGTAQGIAGGVCSIMSQMLLIAGFFLISGIFEKSTGTADLKKLGGIAKKLPVTSVCFAVFTLSVLGFPYFCGYFTNMPIYTAVGMDGIAFLICMLIAAVITAVALIKVCHTIFFGMPEKQNDGQDSHKAGAVMLLPVCVLAVACLASVLVFPELALYFGIKPEVYGSSAPIYIVSFLLCLVIALIIYFVGFRKIRDAAASTEYIEKAPKSIFEAAAMGQLDPYNWFLAAVGVFSDLCFLIERGVSWFYDKGIPGLVTGTGFALHEFNNGRLSRYLSLAVAGTVIIAAIFLVILL